MGRKIKHIIRSKEMLLILILAIVVLVIRLINQYFLSLGSLAGIMQAMSLTGIIAVGVGALLIGGSIDLSATQVYLFGGIICAMLIRSGIPWGFAMILAMATGAVVGAINAFFISKLNMMPFIITIAMSNVISGINLTLTDVQNLPVSVESFWWGGKMLFGAIPYPFIIMVILMVGYGFLLKSTRFGRNVYLVGGNMAAARLAGVNPVKIRTVLYINSSVLASFAGIVLVSRMQTAIPSQNTDIHINAITAAVLGGIAFTGGAGGLAGCFIGVTLLSFFNAGLSSFALDAFWSLIASGVLLMIALAADYLNGRSREKMLGVKIRPISNEKRRMLDE